MSRPTELLTLSRVQLHPLRIEEVDCFGGMEAATRHIEERPDPECSYVITDIGDNIRAVGMVAGGKLLLLTSRGEARVFPRRHGGLDVG